LNGDQPSIEKQNLCFRRTSFRRFHRRVNEGRVSYPRGPARLSHASGNTGLGFLTVVQGYYCLAQPLGALGMGVALSEKFSQQSVPVLAQLEKLSDRSCGRPVVLLHDDRQSRGCVSTAAREWRTIWIVDAHRDDGERFDVRADEKLTAFLELQAPISGRERRTQLLRNRA
jgi:hypothetical protein